MQSTDRADLRYRAPLYLRRHLDTAQQTRKPAAPAAREVIRKGRRYLEAPITLIKPGLVDNGECVILYPANLLREYAPAWNGIPLTLNHPNTWGYRVVLGHLEQVRTNTLGDLVGNGLFDVEALRTYAPRVLRQVRAGLPVEVSTGVSTSPTGEPAGTTADGQPYFVANAFEPDHLAILTDQPGACSVADGAGVNNIVPDPLPITENSARHLADYLTYLRQQDRANYGRADDLLIPPTL